MGSAYTLRSASTSCFASASFQRATAASGFDAEGALETDAASGAELESAELAPTATGSARFDTSARSRQAFRLHDSAAVHAVNCSHLRQRAAPTRSFPAMRLMRSS